MHTSLSNLARLGTGVRSCRHSSWNRTGANNDFWLIPPGETVTLGEMTGPGCIKHLWMTTDEAEFTLRGLVLRMYWDGEETPSVQCPLGDFFGAGHAKGQYLTPLPLQVFGLGMNCWFSMPYAAGARVTMTNDMSVDARLYFYIDYQDWQAAPADMGRFHANWRRELVLKEDDRLEHGPNGFENRTYRGRALGRDQSLNLTGDDNYLILSANGRGHYVGCVMHLDTNEPGWWGEGDDMIFIDGQPWPPRLHGTGMEDYFCGAFAYDHLRTFCGPYCGYHFTGNADHTGKHSQYRFHVEDPLYFERSIRVTMEHGHGNDHQGDWSSTAYWYQIERSEPLPDLGGFEERMPYAWGGSEAPGQDRRGLPA
jgi:hypothetical protein